MTIKMTFNQGDTRVEYTTNSSKTWPELVDDYICFLRALGFCIKGGEYLEDEENEYNQKTFLEAEYEIELSKLNEKLKEQTEKVKELENENKKLTDANIAINFLTLDDESLCPDGRTCDCCEVDEIDEINKAQVDAMSCYTYGI